jgi:hypothetical protein
LALRSGTLCLLQAQNGSFAVDFGGVRLRSSVQLTPNTWYNVAATKAFSHWKLDTTQLYINGVAVPLTVRSFSHALQCDTSHLCAARGLRYRTHNRVCTLGGSVHQCVCAPGLQSARCCTGLAGGLACCLLPTHPPVPAVPGRCAFLLLPAVRLTTTAPCLISTLWQRGTRRCRWWLGRAWPLALPPPLWAPPTSRASLVRCATARPNGAGRSRGHRVE